jgi:hypothetical protein
MVGEKAGELVAEKVHGMVGWMAAYLVACLADHLVGQLAVC